MKYLLIVILILSLTGCANCKKGQVKLDGQCYDMGRTYTTDIFGKVIRD